jgi:hypothetical protein
MDILTPKGQKTVEEEDDAASLFEAAYPGYLYIRTPKDKPSPVDAIIARDGVATAVAECKCRHMTLDRLKFGFKWEWLVTNQKIVEGVQASNLLSIPYVGFLFLLPERVLLMQKIYDPDKDAFIPSMRIERTMTQATVNGGVANRVNAFIDMSGATIIRGTTSEAA